MLDDLLEIFDDWEDDHPIVLFFCVYGYIAAFIAYWIFFVEWLSQ